MKQELKNKIKKWNTEAKKWEKIFPNCTFYQNKAIGKTEVYYCKDEYDHPLLVGYFDLMMNM